MLTPARAGSEVCVRAAALPHHCPVHCTHSYWIALTPNCHVLLLLSCLGFCDDPQDYPEKRLPVWTRVCDGR